MADISDRIRYTPTLFRAVIRYSDSFQYGGQRFLGEKKQNGLYTDTAKSVTPLVLVLGSADYGGNHMQEI